MNDFNVEAFIKIAADSIEQLRKPDVYRLIESVPLAHLPALCRFIKENRQDLAEEVDDVLAEQLNANPSTKMSKLCGYPNNS